MCVLSLLCVTYELDSPASPCTPSRRRAPWCCRRTRDRDRSGAHRWLKNNKLYFYITPTIIKTNPLTRLSEYLVRQLLRVDVVLVGGRVGAAGHAAESVGRHAESNSRIQGENNYRF